MTLLALALVLAAAGVHATWNLFAKRATGGAAFVWLVNVLATLLYAPLAFGVVLAQHPHLGPRELLFMAGSAVLETGYFLMLQRAYRVGDLSLVYPLARGSGPMLATLAAIVLLHERPSPLALAGAALIAGGVVVLVGDPRRFRGTNAAPAAAYALLTGAFIASYTLWDKYAVAVLRVPPMIQHWGTLLGIALLTTPLAAQRREQVRRIWREDRVPALVVALLSPLSYVLVLTALTFAPVSYVAPAREISILFGALLGARLLSEGDVSRRLVAAGVMVLGIVALALG